MRVRMLKQFEDTVTHPEHGSLAIVYAAGTSPSFDDATADTLVTLGVAEKDPELSERVKMLRTVTDTELAELLDQSPAAVEGIRFDKGALVHFPAAIVAKLIKERIAEAAPDPDYDPIGASRQAAIDGAIARKVEADAAATRRDAMKLQAETAAAPSRATSKVKQPSAPASATPTASNASTSSTSTAEG